MTYEFDVGTRLMIMVLGIGFLALMAYAVARKDAADEREREDE